jgi:sulfur-carrier protein
MTAVVTVRYWAAARAASGMAQENVAADTLAEVLDEVRLRHPSGELERVLKRCSFLVDEAPVGLREPSTVQLTQGAVVEVLPPFAGG